MGDRQRHSAVPRAHWLPASLPPFPPLPSDWLQLSSFYLPRPNQEARKRGGLSVSPATTRGGASRSQSERGYGARAKGRGQGSELSQDGGGAGTVSAEREQRTGPQPSLPPVIPYYVFPLCPPAALRYLWALSGPRRPPSRAACVWGGCPGGIRLRPSRPRLRPSRPRPPLTRSPFPPLRRRPQLLLLLGALYCGLSAAVDRSNFKTCEQSSFCRWGPGPVNPPRCVCVWGGGG